MNPMLRRVNNFAEVPVTGDLEEIIEIREEKSGKAMVLYSDVTTAEKHFEDLQTLSSVDVELYTENLICIEAKPYEVYVENTDAEDLLEEISSLSHFIGVCEARGQAGTTERRQLSKAKAAMLNRLE